MNKLGKQVHKHEVFEVTVYTDASITGYGGVLYFNERVSSSSKCVKRPEVRDNSLSQSSIEGFSDKFCSH